MMTKATLPDIKQRLMDICSKNHISIYKLAKQSGISYSSLYSMLRRGTHPSLATLCCLCSGLNISLSDFFSDNELKLPPLDDDCQKLVTLYNMLSDTKKQLLMAYLYGLCDCELSELTVT